MSAITIDLVSRRDGLRVNLRQTGARETPPGTRLALMSRELRRLAAEMDARGPELTAKLWPQEQEANQPSNAAATAGPPLLASDEA